MRISLIVAILAALAAGTLNVLQVRGHITTLISAARRLPHPVDGHPGKLAKTQRDLATTKNTLAQTQQQLADSQAAQKKAETLAAAQQKRADDLSDKLAKATQDRDTAQAELAAYKATGKSPDEILKLITLIKQDQDTIAAINAEKAVLARNLLRVQNQLDELIRDRIIS